MQTRILEQASELFIKSGIRSVTMDEIAESLGMSKRTLYEYFPNKEKLLKECILYKHKIYSEEMKQLLDTIDNPLEIIHIHISKAIKNISQIHPNFSKDLKKYHPKILQDVFLPLKEKNTAYTKEVITRGKKQGYFRQDIDPDIMADLIHIQFHRLDEFPLDRHPKTEVFKHIVMGLIRGMATEKGMKNIKQLFENENN